MSMSLVKEETLWIYRHAYRITTYSTTYASPKCKYFSYTLGMENIIGNGSTVSESVEDIRSKLLDYCYTRACKLRHWELEEFTEDEITWMKVCISGNEEALENLNIW